MTGKTNNPLIVATILKQTEDAVCDACGFVDSIDISEEAKKKIQLEIAKVTAYVFHCGTLVDSETVMKVNNEKLKQINPELANIAEVLMGAVNAMKDLKDRK